MCHFIFLLFILFYAICFYFLFIYNLFIYFYNVFCYFLKMSHFIYFFSYLFIIIYYLLLLIIIYYFIIYFIFYFYLFLFIFSLFFLFFIFHYFFYLICRFTEFPEIKITAESLGCQRPWLIRPGIGHLQGHWMANSCNRPSAYRHLTRLLGRWKCTCSQGQTFAFRERKMLGESFQVLTLGAPGGRESCGHIPSAYQFNSFTHQHIF